MTQNNCRKIVYKENGFLPKVSVIVITYNQDLDKIIATLDSIVAQVDISFEIIICDDGSNVIFENEIIEYFRSKGFLYYTLIFHDENKGTVSNYLSGLLEAKGKYTKLISPGDYFTENMTLYKWVSFLRESGADWSFSDAYYYQDNDGSRFFFGAKALPQIIRPYLKNDKKECIWNYVALTDVANGAAIIGTKNTQVRFCEIIKDNGIRYCEDYIYRLMTLHGIVGCYYSEPAICYEYGTGVSTSGNELWKAMLAEDRYRLIQLLKDDKSLTKQQKKLAKVMITTFDTKKIKKIFIRNILIYWMKYRFFPRLTPIPNKLCKQDENT